MEIAEEKDQFGIPVAKATFDLHDNDKKLIEFGKKTVMEVMRAAGARRSSAGSPATRIWSGQRAWATILRIGCR